MNPIGVMQGRLLPKYKGRYQAHPVNTWHKEFEIAEKLNMDPIELRLLNVARKGDRMPSGPVLPEVGTEEIEKAMKNHPHYNTP